MELCIIVLGFITIIGEFGLIAFELYKLLEAKKTPKSPEKIVLSKEEQDKFLDYDKESAESLNKLISDLNTFMMDKEVDTDADRQEE